MEKYFKYLFDRPCEPIFIPKGEERVNFEVQTKNLPDDYKPIATRIVDHYNSLSQTSIKVEDIAIPDLTVPLSLARNASFSLFGKSHREKANYLLSVFMELRTVEDLLYVAASCRDRMNPSLFVYALSVALLHRPDTKNVQIPLLSEIFPAKYLDSSVLKSAKEQANIVPAGSRIPIEIPMNWTASNKDPEHHVAYFREDVGINLHHWHWHLVYPFDGPEKVVKKDRRGELFYYMHHQIVARYNAERFSNNLPRATPLNFREPIPEGYFPKLDHVVAGRAYPSRAANSYLSNLDRSVEEIQFTIADLEQWKQTILDAIEAKEVLNTSGTTTKLDDTTGIDILGNLLESSPVLSVNYELYGNLHNSVHLALAYCHDPDERYLENSAIMADSTVSMRDPVFYKWHTSVDDIFNKFKDSLRAYTNDELSFKGVSISKVGITSSTSNPNTLNTYWTKSELDLSRGLDFTPRGAVLARIQHLNHDEYSYAITISNANDKIVKGTVRIFIAPRFDGAGRSLSFSDQRHLWIEMDKFVVTLKKGQNTITRKSTDSSVTIPFEATFRDLNKNRPEDSDIEGTSNYSFCGCGWPQHMLVPKGNKAGFPMDLFVMISDYEQDKVDQDDPTGCRTGVSFCGLKNRKYPDARPMGFPFDRPARTTSKNAFLTSNMLIQQITVRFTDTVKPRQTSNTSTKST